MLVRENEATNKVILENDLVGVIIGINEVNVIKNRYNGVMGKIPLFLWKQLEEDYENLGINEQETQETVDDHDDFAAFSELNSILDMLNKAGEAPREKVKEATEEVMDFLNQGNSNLERIKREIAKKAIKREAQEKVNQGKEAINDVANTLGNIFGDIVDGFDEFVSDIEPKMDRASKDIKDTVDAVGVRVELAKLKALRESALEQNVATKGFLKKINAKIVALEMY